MSEESDQTTDRVITIVQSSLPITSATALDVDSSQGVQSVDLTLDGVGEKNPFSNFSEEHLSRLDDFLSTEEAQKILQQTTVGPLGTGGKDSSCVESDTDAPGDNSEDLLGILDNKSEDQADLGSPFSDHAYAIPVKRTTRTSLPGTTPLISSPRKRPYPKDEVMIVSDVGNDVEISQVETKPGRGRGRGRKSQGEIPLGAPNNRRSSRISDNEQREMAEKIRQENLQKEKEELEAMKSGEKDEEQEKLPQKKGRGRPKKIEEEEEIKQVAKRGHSKARKNEEEESSESESEDDTEKKETKKGKRGRPKKVKESEDDKESENERESESKKTGKGKRGRPKKVPAKDSGSEMEDSPKQKGKKGRSLSRTKKQDDDADDESEEGSPKKGKKKGKLKKAKGKQQDSESESEEESPKKGKRGRPKKNKAKEEESDSEEKSPRKGKVKGKKGKEKELETESEEDSPKNEKKGTKKGKGKKKSESENESPARSTAKKGKGKKQEEIESDAKGKKGKQNQEVHFSDEESTSKTGKKKTLKGKGVPKKGKAVTVQTEESSDDEKTDKNKKKDMNESVDNLKGKKVKQKIGKKKGEQEKSSDDNEDVPLSSIKKESSSTDKKEGFSNIFDALIACTTQDSSPTKDKNLLAENEDVNAISEPEKSRLESTDTQKDTKKIEENNKTPKSVKKKYRKSEEFLDMSMTDLFKPDGVIPNDDDHIKTNDSEVKHRHDSASSNQGAENVSLDQNSEKKSEIMIELDEKKDEEVKEATDSDLIDKTDISTPENLVDPKTDENAKIKEMYRSTKGKVEDLNSSVESNFEIVSVTLESDADEKEAIQFEATIENVEFVSMPVSSETGHFVGEGATHDVPVTVDDNKKCDIEAKEMVNKSFIPESVTQKDNSKQTKTAQVEIKLESDKVEKSEEKKKTVIAGRKSVAKVAAIKSSSDLDTSDVTGSEVEEDRRVLRRKRTRNPLVEEFLQKETKKRKKTVKSEDETTDKEIKKDEKEKKEEKKEPAVEKKKEEVTSHEEEGEEDEEEDDDDLDSEEEYEPPDQKYCICNKPYGNKFMICCDRCENWYHGKCIGITRARGKEMEDNKEDYICDNCKEKEKIDKIKGKSKSEDGKQNKDAGSKPLVVKIPGVVKGDGKTKKKVDLKKIVKVDQKSPSSSKFEKKIVTKSVDNKTNSVSLTKTENKGLSIKSDKTKIAMSGKSDQNSGTTVKVVKVGKTGNADNSVEKSGKSTSASGKSDMSITPGKTDKVSSTLGKTDKVSSTPGKSDKVSSTPGKSDKVNSIPGKTEVAITTSGKTEKVVNSEKTPGKITPAKIDSLEIFTPDKAKIPASIKKTPSIEQKKSQEKLPLCIGPKCGKQARSDSVYCSNECIINHSQDSLNIIHSQQESSVKRPSKLKGDKRIVVIEKTTGKILTGDKAPTEAELCAWLEKNPSFSVLCPTIKKLKAERDRRESSPSEHHHHHNEHYHHKHLKHHEEKKDSGDNKDHKDRRDSSKDRKKVESKDRKRSHSDSSKNQKSHSSHRKHDDKNKHKSSDKKDDKAKTQGKPEDAGPDPVRLNVRKSLRDALAARAEKADDVMLSLSEIKSLAVDIEHELFNLFKETGHKYKNKYRSLIFNIKDVKNKGLFRKILNGELKPSRLIKMTPEELASRELAKWREFETKHELDMIVQAEEEIMKEGIHFVKKTHKGEIEVDPEHTEEEDLSTLEDHGVEKPKTKKTDKKEAPIVDFVGSLIGDTTSQHKNHLFDLNCRICTGKELPPVRDTTPKKVRVARTVRIEEPSSSEKDGKKSEEEKKKAEEVVKEVLKAIQKAKKEQMEEAKKAEEQKTQQLEQTPEPSEPVADSTVTVRSPDSALQSGLEQKPDFTPKGPQVWKGFVSMQDVAKFVTTAYRISGPSDKLNIPDTIHVCGRISPEQVFDYLSKMRKVGTKDIIVLRFIPGPNEEKTSYINLYSYLNSRSRCGVVGSVSRYIKDFYILPLASHSKIPSVIKPFIEQGLERNRPHMLLALIVRQKLKPHGVESEPKLRQKHDQVQKVRVQDKRPYTPPGQKSYGPLPKIPKTENKDSPEMYDPEKPTVDSKPYVPPSDEVVFKKPALPVKRSSPSSSPGGSVAKTLLGAGALVSQMMEKVKLSANAIEANEIIMEGLSPMVTITDKQKVLLELTQRVCEQKKLIELKHAGKPSQEAVLPLTAVANAMTAISQISKTLVSAPKRTTISASQQITKTSTTVSENAETSKNTMENMLLSESDKLSTSTSENDIVSTSYDLALQNTNTNSSSATNKAEALQTYSNKIFEPSVVSTSNIVAMEAEQSVRKTPGLLPHEAAVHSEKISLMPEALKSLFSSIPGSYSHVTKFEESNPVRAEPAKVEIEDGRVENKESDVDIKGESIDSNQHLKSASENFVQPNTAMQAKNVSGHVQAKTVEQEMEGRDKFNVSLLEFDYGDSDSESEIAQATPSATDQDNDTRPSSVMSSSSEESQDSTNIPPLQYPPLPAEPDVPPPLPDEPPPPPPDHDPEEEEVSEEEEGETGKKSRKKKKKKKKGKKDRPAPEIVLEAKDPISKAILDASFRRLMEKQQESMVPQMAVPPISPVVGPQNVPMSCPNVPMSGPNVPMSGPNVPMSANVTGAPFQPPGMQMAGNKPPLLPTPVLNPQMATGMIPQSSPMVMSQPVQPLPLVQQKPAVQSIPSLFDVDVKPSRNLDLAKLEIEPENELDRELRDLADADWRTGEPEPQDLDLRQDQDLRVVDVDMRQPVQKQPPIAPVLWPEDVDHRKGGRYTPDPVFGSDLQLPSEDSDLRNFCSPLDQDYRRRDMPPKDTQNVTEDQDFRVGHNKHGNRRGSHDRDFHDRGRRRRHEDSSHRKSKRRRRDDDRHHSRHDEDRDHRHRDKDYRKADKEQDKADKESDTAIPQDVDQRQKGDKKAVPPPPPRLADKVPVPPPQVLAQKAATEPPKPPPLQPPPLPPGIEVQPFVPTPSQPPRRTQPPPPGIDDW